MILVKSHGLGNDYLVLDALQPGRPLPDPEFALRPATARMLCDRHRGLGADGVLEPVECEDGWGLRIWNPDGSEAEKSGNGLRIFARFLVERRGAPTELSIRVAAGLMHCRVAEDEVTVCMGKATFVPSEIPVSVPLYDAPLHVAGTTLRLTAVGLGNPHCVALVDEDLDSLPWRAWGSALETDPRFPNRTNVQIARVRSRQLVEARIWERGAGETSASGSSACAVAAVVHSLGLADPRVSIHMPGGALDVHIDSDGEITLRGPVEEVAEIRLSLGLRKRLLLPA